MRYVRLPTGKVIHIVKENSLIKNGFTEIQYTLCGIRYNPKSWDLRQYFPSISNHMKLCNNCDKIK